MPEKNYTVEEFKEVKTNFDKLTYNDKLKFWAENIDPTVFYKTYSPDNNGDSITVEPATPLEQRKINEWILNFHQQQDHYNVEKFKEKYFETVKVSPLPIDYTEKELSLIENQLTKDKELPEIYQYYTYGYLSAMQNHFPHLAGNILPANFISYAAGIRDANYKGFLLTQLEQLRQRGKVLPDTAIHKAEFEEIKKAKPFLIAKQFNSLNNAFFRLESFMNGILTEYQYFGFNDAFTKIFIEAKKTETYTFENCKLISKYWSLTEQIRIDYDKSDFENADAYENESFCKDCEEIMHLNYERIEEFNAFSTPDEIEESERKFSITDILKNNSLSPKRPETKTSQPLPKVEKSTLEQDKKTATKYLQFLTGCNIHKEKIMSDSDFKNLINYTCHLIEFEALPANIKPITQIKIPTETLRYTFYLIHKELYTTKRIKNIWIEFLHNVFRQFQNVEQKTTKTKFSVSPSSYDADMKEMKTKKSKR